MKNRSTWLIVLSGVVLAMMVLEAGFGWISGWIVPDQWQQAEQLRSSSIVRLTVLKQRHRRHTGLRGAGERIENILKVARSQFKIAKYLVQRPEAIVIEEGNTMNLGPSHLRYLRDSQNSGWVTANKVFPNGFPKDAEFSDLNVAQKSFLYVHQAPYTLYLLGQRSEIRRSIFARDQDFIQRRAMDYLRSADFDYAKAIQIEGFRELVFGERERRAVTEVMSGLSDVRRDAVGEVVLIYGAAHSFAKFFDGSYGIDYREVDTTSSDTLENAYRFSLNGLNIDRSVNQWDFKDLVQIYTQDQEALSH